jgi:hypothetical protein
MLHASSRFDPFTGRPAPPLLVRSSFEEQHLRRNQWGSAMRILGSAIFAVAAAMASSAWAGPTDEATATPAVAKSTVECHRLYHEGALVGQPVCRTHEQWAATRNYIQRQIRQYQLSFLTHGR